MKTSQSSRSPQSPRMPRTSSQHSRSPQSPRTSSPHSPRTSSRSPRTLSLSRSSSRASPSRSSSRLLRSRLSPRAPRPSSSLTLSRVDSVASQQDSVRARLKRAAQDGADLRPRKKRRAIAIPESGDSDASADAVSDDDEYEVVRVSQHRENDGQRQYLVTWEDGSTAWKDGGDLEGCAKLIQLYERYIGKYPDKMITYAKFIHRDVPAMRLMAANHGDDCAVHAVATLFLMIGLHEEAMALEKLGRAFIASLTVKSSDRVVPSSRSRGLKFVELIRFLRDEVPKVGWRIDLDAFSKKNWYCGQKKGWEAVAALAFSEKMEEG
uniref:Chromo domain-containing protein n=1 Tax=Globisporangium ultimum (strain ATCC 200006 / CBS 805.95 / DAOM BR144) TaxID=431595 RepID=K3XD47_GLOUD